MWKKPAIFRRDHDHDRDRLAGRPLSVYLRREIEAAADRQRGDRSMSGHLSDLIQEREARQSGVALPKKEVGPIPPLLKDATAYHAQGRNQSTGNLIIQSTAVTPNAEVARRLEQSNTPFSIRHDEELPPSARVSQGRHRLAPEKCQGCVLAVRDAYSWC